MSHLSSRPLLLTHQLDHPSGERTGARPEKAFGPLLRLDYDLMLKSWHGNRMLSHKKPQPRSRSRGGPSASAARLFCRQSSALHTLLVRASEAGRITSEGSVINKPGRSAISRQQISPKHLKWTLVPHLGSFRSVHPLQHVARRPSCSTGGLTTSCHCALPPCPPPSRPAPLNDRSLAVPYSSVLTQLPLLVCEFSKAFCFCCSEQLSKDPPPCTTPHLHHTGWRRDASALKDRADLRGPAWGAQCRVCVRWVRDDSFAV